MGTPRILDNRPRGGFPDHRPDRSYGMARKKRRKKSGGSHLSPGVYMEEVSSGSKPIEGVGTAVAAFVGFARSHPVPVVVAALATFAAVAAVVRAIRR
jgi:hypothetical protein